MRLPISPRPRFYLQHTKEPNNLQLIIYMILKLVNKILCLLQVFNNVVESNWYLSSFLRPFLLIVDTFISFRSLVRRIKKL